MATSYSISYSECHDSRWTEQPGPLPSFLPSPSDCIDPNTPCAFTALDGPAARTKQPPKNETPPKASCQPHPTQQEAVRGTRGWNNKSIRAKQCAELGPIKRHFTIYRVKPSLPLFLSISLTLSRWISLRDRSKIIFIIMLQKRYWFFFFLTRRGGGRRTPSSICYSDNGIYLSESTSRWALCWAATDNSVRCWRLYEVRHGSSPCSRRHWGQQLMMRSWGRCDKESVSICTSVSKPFFSSIELSLTRDCLDWHTMHLPRCLRSCAMGSAFTPRSC
jgi:hypothetical protein